MPQVTGRIIGLPHQREPMINLGLRAPGFGARLPGTTVRVVLIDSGFDDTLILPAKAIQPLVAFLPSLHKRRVYFSELEWEWYDSYRVEVFWMGRWEEHEIYVHADATPMIGMHFLEGCLIDFRAGKVGITRP